MNRLFDSDYEVALVDNRDGALCTSYPPQLVIAERVRRDPPGNRRNDAAAIRPLIQRSRLARVHCRFAVPVILFRGKNVLRSATLAVSAERCARARCSCGGRGLFLLTRSRTRSWLNHLQARGKQFFFSYFARPSAADAEAAAATAAAAAAEDAADASALANGAGAAPAGAGSAADQSGLFYVDMEAQRNADVALLALLGSR